MDKKLKVGLCGIGRIGKMHAENLKKYYPDIELAGVADPFLDQSADWLKANGIDKAFADYRELLKEDLDALIVASSTDTHAEISLAAIERGLHVFCEKPLDSDVTKIQQVVQAVDKAGIKFQTGFNRRYDHNFRRVREEVEKGVIGEPHVVRVTSRDPAPPPMEYVKVSGGILFDMTIHDFDMLRFLSGSDVTEISAIGAVLVDPQFAEYGDVDTVLVTVRFANGALGSIDNSRQAVYGYDQRVEVFGSKGMVKAENDFVSSIESYVADTTTKDKIPYFFLDRYDQAYRDQFADFFAAIREDRPTSVDAVDGLRAVQVAIAATESLKTGKPVQLKY